jgi:NADPH2:quinone reductase
VTTSLPLIPGHALTILLQEENRAIIGYRDRAYLQWRPEVMVQAANTVLKRITDGEIGLVIGARFSLRDAAAAYRLVENRESIGKVLLRPSSYGR